METKTEIKDYIENLTGKAFPNLCKLSKSEIKEIKQLAVDSDVFWKQGAPIEEKVIGIVGCGAVCEHGHNSLTCPECMDSNL